jgi:hypothetical protein
MARIGMAHVATLPDPELGSIWRYEMVAEPGESLD